EHDGGQHAAGGGQRPGADGDLERVEEPVVSPFVSGWGAARESKTTWRYSPSSAVPAKEPVHDPSGRVVRRNSRSRRRCSTSRYLPSWSRWSRSRAASFARWAASNR